MSIACLCLLLAVQGDGAVQLTPLAKGASKKIGGYAPQKAAFSAERPAALKRVPDGLAAPAYGALPIAPGDAVAFVLDEPEGAPARLFVDSNRNGDLADDPAAEWTAETRTGKDGASTTMHQGSALVDIGDAGKPWLVNVALYRFDKRDPKRAEQKDTLFYYRDYAYEGELQLGGKRYTSMLADELARGDFRGRPTPEGAEKQRGGSGVVLLLDVNANGKFDSRGERFDVLAPFNIGGTTWEIAEMARSGASFKIVKSSKTVAEIPTPPDHTVGKTITSFTAKDTAGNAVSFPADFKGKVVLLDFWATWCGPCMVEMPNVVAAYGKHHANGFEVLGISLDSDKSISKMPDVMQKAGMTWRQVADGKYWEAEIAQLYAVNSIPATFLVDGTTGKILGAGLRGEALDKAIEEALRNVKSSL